MQPTFKSTENHCLNEKISSSIFPFHPSDIMISQAFQHNPGVFMSSLAKIWPYSPWCYHRKRVIPWSTATCHFSPGLLPWVWQCRIRSQELNRTMIDHGRSRLDINYTDDVCVYALNDEMFTTIGTQTINIYFMSVIVVRTLWVVRVVISPKSRCGDLRLSKPVVQQIPHATKFVNAIGPRENTY